MNKLLERLGLEQTDAANALRSINALRDEEIQAVYEKYRVQLDKANRRLAEIREAMDAERDRVKLEEAVPELPIGTKVEQWQMWIGETPKRTGLVGIIEIWKRDSVIPGNKRYCIPSVGQTVVRLLKKDGTTGTRIDQYYPGRWKPVEEVVK